MAKSSWRVTLVALMGFSIVENSYVQAFVANNGMSMTRKNALFVPFHPARRGLQMTTGPSDGVDFDEDEEEAEPGTMRVSEIKAELSLRGVDFSGCFDKESLVDKLRGARTKGLADPSILEEFNKKKLDENFKGEKLEIDDDDINQAVAGDGTLPGGMSPDVLKKLVGNPELMTLLQSTKMQAIMTLMMTDGQEALEKKMEADPEVRDMVQKLNEIMGKV
eukprot:scaffold26782_cov51-Attheya_sp.AAC.1